MLKKDNTPSTYFEYSLLELQCFLQALYKYDKTCKGTLKMFTLDRNFLSTDKLTVTRDLINFKNKTNVLNSIEIEH